MSLNSQWLTPVWTAIYTPPGTCFGPPGIYPYGDTECQYDWAQGVRCSESDDWYLDDYFDLSAPGPALFVCHAPQGTCKRTDVPSWHKFFRGALSSVTAPLPRLVCQLGGV
jgi:hypothetical protein